MAELKEELFSLSMPALWTLRRDEGCLYLVSTTPPGVLCSTSERVADTEELPNLSRMLAGFLTRTGHTVAPNELLILSNIPGAAGFCWQYVQDQVFYRYWIFGNAKCWVFWNFTSAAADMESFHPVLEQIVRSLKLEFDGGRS